jgi:hypothetical protein
MVEVKVRSDMFVGLPPINTSLDGGIFSVSFVICHHNFQMRLVLFEIDEEYPKLKRIICGNLPFSRTVVHISQMWRSCSANEYVTEELESPTNKMQQ